MPTVVIEAGARVDVQRPGPLRAVRREHRPGDFFDAVDAIGSTRQRMDAGQACERDAQRLQEHDIAPAPLISSSRTAPGRAILLRPMRASAPAQVLASATVGPEAMSLGASPGTPEISRVTMRAGWQAAARRPPFSADRWRRTQFLSPMLAPLASKALLIACLSARLRQVRRQAQRRLCGSHGGIEQAAQQQQQQQAVVGLG